MRSPGKRLSCCGEDHWVVLVRKPRLLIKKSIVALQYLTRPEGGRTTWVIIELFNQSLLFPSLRHLSLYLLYWRWFLWFTDNWNSSLLCWSINLAVTAFMAVSVRHNILAIRSAGEADMLRNVKHCGIPARLIRDGNKSPPSHVPQHGH